jgi:hypothetical protein
MIRPNVRKLTMLRLSLLTPLALGLAGCTVVEENGPPPAAPSYVQAPAPAPAPVVESDDAALQQLVAPVALYPDPLLAVVLPASTFPDQIQQAAYWQQMNNGAPDYVIAQQPWDPSVQALVHYPTVLQYMSGDIQWTTSLGSAFASDQPGVMNAVQELRAQAMACGSLQSSPQMEVIQNGPCIYLQPVNPNVICVPSYDAVYAYQRPEVVTYSVTYGVGAWLVYGFDWDNRSFYRGDWHEGWQPGPNGWQRQQNWQPQAQPWVRDQSHGPPPRIEPARYVAPQQIRANPQQFRAAPALRIPRAPTAQPQHQVAPDVEHRTDLPPQTTLPPQQDQQHVAAGQPYQAKPMPGQPEQNSPDEHGTRNQNPGTPVQNAPRPNEPTGPGEQRGPGQPVAAEKQPAGKQPAPNQPGVGPQDKSKTPPKAPPAKTPTDDHSKDQGQNQNQDQNQGQDQRSMGQRQ